MGKGKFNFVFGGYMQKDIWKTTNQPKPNNDELNHNHPNTHILQTHCHNSTQGFSSRSPRLYPETPRKLCKKVFDDDFLDPIGSDKSPQETRTPINFDFVFGGYKQINSDKEKETPKQRVLRILTKK